MCKLMTDEWIASAYSLANQGRYTPRAVFLRMALDENKALRARVAELEAKAGKWDEWRAKLNEYGIELGEPLDWDISWSQGGFVGKTYKLHRD